MKKKTTFASRRGSRGEQPEAGDWRQSLGGVQYAVHHPGGWRQRHRGGQRLVPQLGEQDGNYAETAKMMGNMVKVMGDSSHIASFTKK